MNKASIYGSDLKLKHGNMSDYVRHIYSEVLSSVLDEVVCIASKSNDINSVNNILKGGKFNG